MGGKKRKLFDGGKQGQKKKRGTEVGKGARREVEEHGM